MAEDAPQIPDAGTGPWANEASRRCAAPVARATATPRRWLVLCVACVALLGQGERFYVDARFRTPSAVLETYWQAIRTNDLLTVTECFTEPQESMPFPGMLWFLPPVDGLELRAVRLRSAESRRVVASYEVGFVPAGTGEELMFVTTTELRRMGREWRMVRPAGEPSMPEWRPYPHTVDS